MIHSIGGIRFRSDIQLSFCCDPADTINIQTGVAIAQPTAPPDPDTIERGDDGAYTIEVRQGEHIELRTPRGFESAYQLGASGERRALPAGSTWDAASQTFYRQPAPGFLGRYRIVFSNGAERISVRVIVLPE